MRIVTPFNDDPHLHLRRRGDLRLLRQRLRVTLPLTSSVKATRALGDVELEHRRQTRFVDLQHVAAVVVDGAARGDGHGLVHQHGDQLGDLVDLLGDAVAPEVADARVLFVADVFHLLFVHVVADADQDEVDARQPAGGDLFGDLPAVGFDLVGVVQHAVGDEDRAAAPRAAAGPAPSGS